MHAGVFDHAEPVHRSQSRDGPCCLPTLIRRQHSRELSFAAQWPACTIPCRRFAAALADDNARLGASVARYAFAVEDFHLLLLAGLPAHIKQRVNQRPLAAPRWEKIIIATDDFGDSYLLIQQNCYFHGR